MDKPGRMDINPSFRQRNPFIIRISPRGGAIAGHVTSVGIDKPGTEGNKPDFD